MRGRGCAALGVALVLCGMASAPAMAVFPGRNGDLLSVDFNLCGGTQNCPPPSFSLARISFNGTWKVNYGSAPNISGAYSPDGTRVAITTTPDGAIFVENADGSGEKQVAPQTPSIAGSNTGYDTVSWLPDGRHVVYADSFGQLFEADVDLGVFAPIDVGSFADSPVVSPDGSHIAYRPHGVSSQLWVMNFNGTLAHPVAATASAAGRVDHVSWAPSGRVLAFRRSPSTGPDEIDTVRIDGSGTHLVALSVQSAVWSPDGTKLLAGATLMNPNGSNPQPQPQLAGAVYYGAFVDWQALP